MAVDASPRVWIVSARRATLPESTTMTTWKIAVANRSEEHTSELQSQSKLVCRLLLEQKKRKHSLLRITATNRRGHHQARIHRHDPRRPPHYASSRPRPHSSTAPLRRMQPRLDATPRP